MYDNDNIDYVSMRLTGTIIRHNGRAVSVLAVKNGREGFNIFSKYLFNGEEFKDSMKNYDLTPVQLGFVNTGMGSRYVTRVPLRQDWRQGLRSLNARCDGDHVNFGDLGLINLAKTIEGNFPSFANCCEEARHYKMSRAWSRDFCVMPDKTVRFKTYGIVGEVNDGKVLLNPQFTWVEESLKEVM